LSSSNEAAKNGKELNNNSLSGEAAKKEEEESRLRKECTGAFEGEESKRREAAEFNEEKRENQMGKLSEIKKKKTAKKTNQKVQGLTKGFLEENTKCSAFLLEEACSLAKRFGGQCVSTSCESENSILSFKCEMGHQRQCTLSEARNDWCPLCRKTLAQLQEYVRTKFGGRILNNRLAKTLLVRCRNGHEWTCEVK
jgi:hypothetical protein